MLRAQMSLPLLQKWRHIKQGQTFHKQHRRTEWQNYIYLSIRDKMQRQQRNSEYIKNISKRFCLQGCISFKDYKLPVRTRTFSLLTNIFFIFCALTFKRTYWLRVQDTLLKIMLTYINVKNIIQCTCCNMTL